jgi:hypothetical protein
VTATSGSLYAVAQLGHGLIEQHTKQVTVAMVNAELAQDGSARTTNPSLPPSPAVSPKVSHPVTKPGGDPTHHAVPPVKYSRKLLTSEGGWAWATCGPAGAQLLSDSPAQGFKVFRFEPGPSTVASVTFTDSSGGVSMKVTCSSGAPVEHVSTFGWGGGWPHHDE